MAPPFPYTDITNWKVYETGLGNALWGAGTYVKNAAACPTWASAQFSLNAAGNSLQSAALQVIGTGGGASAMFYLNKILVAIWFNWPTTGTLTMGDILTAMLLAKYDELTKFVGIEDAYRSAIWDQPFNSEFYAALARGFMP